LIIYTAHHLYYTSMSAPVANKAKHYYTTCHFKCQQSVFFLSYFRVQVSHAYWRV